MLVVFWTLTMVFTEITKIKITFESDKSDIDTVDDAVDSY